MQQRRKALEGRPWRLDQRDTSWWCRSQAPPSYLPPQVCSRGLWVHRVEHPWIILCTIIFVRLAGLEGANGLMQQFSPVLLPPHCSVWDTWGGGWAAG